MPDSCSPIRQLLSEQRDRTLTTSETQQIRLHLASCASCRGFERDLQAGLAGIVRLPRVGGSATVREAVLGGVHPGGHSSWPRGWRDWTSQALKLTGAVTAFALVAILLMNVFGTSGDGEPDERLSGVGSQPEAVASETAVEPSLPLCVEGQLEFDVSVDRNPGDAAINSPGYVAVNVLAIKSTGGVACRVATSVRLLVEDEAGNPLGIQTNGLSATLDAVVPSDEAQVRFAWLNWCGEEERVVFDVTVENWSTGANLKTPGTPPPCGDPDQPSILGPAIAAEATPYAAINTDCQTAQVVQRPTDDDGLQFWILAPDSDECPDDEQLSVMLTDPDGVPLPIDDSPFLLILRPSQSGDFRWAGLVWTNWCGEANRASIDAAANGYGFGMSIEFVPACLDADEPSTVTISEAEPPTEVWESLPLDDILAPSSVSEPADCEMADVLLDLQATSEGDDIVIEVTATYADVDPTTCKLEIRDLAIDIASPEGSAIGMGASASQSPDANNARQPDDPATMTTRFVWTNWCAEPGPFTITATLANQATSLTIEDRPECVDDGESSTIAGS